jgi:DNA polymerase (family 10)
LPIHNSDVSRILKEIADLLAIEEANQFRVRAYRNAARTVETLSRPVSDLIADEKDLTELDDIGKDMAGKIKEIVKTGELTQLENLHDRIPPDLVEMLKLDGLGPKRVHKIFEQLNVTDLSELEKAAENHEIQKLDGLGPKTEQKILNELPHLQDQDGRILLNQAEEWADSLATYLREIKGVKRVQVAGSYRRGKETVGDLDILVIGEDGKYIIDQFVNFEDVEEVVSKGETRSTVMLRTGLQVDLRVVAAESYGAALFYFTGSKAHNIYLRNMALDRGWKVNEYGVFQDEKRIAGETEQEVYELFDLPFIVPELREDRGEFEAAQHGELPELVTQDDIRGDLQMHTQSSDGHATLKEMAQAARDLGYEYIAITDHSPNLGITQGLGAEGLSKQIDSIERLNDEMEDLRLLKSIEVDILEDGSLDLPDESLQQLDLTICSVHSHFDLSVDQQTDRIIRAMDNPYFNILAHPTGRKIGERPPYEIDMKRLMQAALERGCFLEVNADPSRLDLNDIYIKMAKEMGLKLAISTDAHRLSALHHMRFGVMQARRGWQSADDVLNTRGWKELKELLKR